MADRATDERMISLLRNVGLFSRCSDYELRVVAKKSQRREVDDGELVVAEGQPGSELFIVLSGFATAIKHGSVLHTYGPGEYFGELAALLPAPRSSDVVAGSACLFAVLDTNQVYALVDSIPGVARSMLEGLAADMRERLGST